MHSTYAFLDVSLIGAQVLRTAVLAAETSIDGTGAHHVKTSTSVLDLVPSSCI